MDVGMRVMWDWSVGEWRGTTDSAKRAREHAEAHLGAGEPARVEKVRSACGYAVALGVGWETTGTRDGTVRWASFRDGLSA
jgi:hypothetical protein